MANYDESAAPFLLPSGAQSVPGRKLSNADEIIGSLPLMPEIQSRTIQSAGLGKLFSTCGNADCRSGWLHLWRSRSGPVFEGEWSCSPACTAIRLQSALRRELDGRTSDQPIRPHRIPLGLIMLEQGWITSEQLKQALQAQKAAGAGRFGDYLVGQLGISEQLVTRALSLQRGCPVLSLDYHDPEAMARVLPRLFVDAFGALPLRIAAGKILYLGFESRLDPVLALACERMTGLRVESGLVRGSLFTQAHDRLLKAAFASTELIEAASNAPLIRALTKSVERVKPLESRLVRVHDLIWLRMWKGPQGSALPAAGSVEDVVCSLAVGGSLC